MTNQQIQFQALQETRRSNLAKETETHRSNLASETETNRANVARETETARSNVAKEAETNRSNVAKESETARSNRAKEIFNYVDLGVDAIGRRLDRSADLITGVLKAIPGISSIFGG